MSVMDRHRQTAHNVFLAALWLQVPLIAGVAFVAGAPAFAFAGAGLATAAVASLTWWFSAHQAVVRATNAVALMVEISLILAAMSGEPWQVDVHMYYFAALALVALYCDALAIVAAAATVAVHHLLLNYVLPAAVYPGGGDFSRVVLHAVILIAEAGGLIWLAEMLRRAFADSAAALASAETARATAEAAARALREARQAESLGADARARDRDASALRELGMVKALGAELEKIARGDLTARIEADLDGDFVKIKSNFNDAVEKLQLALREVEDRSHGVRAGVEQSLSAVAGLSQRAARQAANLEETAAALTEINETVNRSAKGAFHARDVVAAADEDAKKSAIIVRQAVEAMAAITDSSSRIGQIIGVIDEIAFQTNLLALNAGVEAARAGESGRGFAVVASEVRALAHRSAQAAKQIKELISTSIAQVEQGAQLVGETGAALQRIVSTVSVINGVVADIADGAKAQSVGLAEISAAVGQMDQLTQQNAAMAAEATTANQSLGEESERLDALLRRFEIGRGRREAAIREELKRAAPHAFAKPARASNTRAAAVAAPRTTVPANDDWQDF